VSFWSSQKTHCFFLLLLVVLRVQVTVSYLSDTLLCLPTDQRAARLKPYGFECGCKRCTSVAYGRNEAVVCPDCRQGVCLFEQLPTPSEPDGAYVCSVPGNRGGGAPCGKRHSPAPIDAAIIGCFRLMASDDSGNSSSSSSGGASGAGHGDASELDRACAVLASVTDVLPPTHWIANIAAIRVSGFFLSAGARSSTLRSSHALHWLVAEYVTPFHHHHSRKSLGDHCSRDARIMTLSQRCHHWMHFLPSHSAMEAKLVC
jgi:hypothetical protein